MNRILHILPRTPVGGVGSFLINSQNSICKDYMFDYLIIEDVKNSQFISTVKSKGSKVFLLNEKLSLFNTMKIKNKIRETLKNNKYLIVHLHSANIASLVFPICKKYNIPIRILHSHATKYSDNIFKSIRNFILELSMFKYTTHLLACSDAAGKFLYRNHNYTTIYNGIDVGKFTIKIEKKEMGKHIIGHVGNFVPCKNHKYLLKVFSNLVAIDDKYELWLFGDGKTRKNIEKLAQKLKIQDKIKFYGRVDNIQKFYNKMDILLLPSFYEGFPVAAMEAQAFGLPIISSDNVTNEIDFYGDNKFLGIEKKDISLWVNAIINTNLNNRLEKSNMFKNSDFVIEKTTKKLEQYYQKCLEETK